MLLELTVEPLPERRRGEYNVTESTAFQRQSHLIPKSSCAFSSGTLLEPGDGILLRFIAEFGYVWLLDAFVTTSDGNSAEENEVLSIDHVCLSFLISKIGVIITIALTL